MCGATGCDRPVQARGHCSRHYKQLLRHGRVQPGRGPRPCAVAGCDRRAEARGWCHGHYLRWRRTGDVQAETPLERRPPTPCDVDGCDRRAHGHRLCRTHLRRLTVLGDVDAASRVRAPGDDGWISHGYRGVVVPPALRHLTRGQTHVLEHRLVMAVLLDRPLVDGESVHHRNGDRLDNRPENLELWSRRQPSGQRVDDKVAFALEILALYDRDSAQALGLDLDPHTGLPRTHESPAS